MSNFDSTRISLKNLLEEVAAGKVQLPDFQRGWVWDDEHIRSLLVSIARAFPIGSLMFLQVGGEARFQIRPVEGVELTAESRAKVELLILDGQQRITSLTQVLRLDRPIKTKDSKKREVERYYYINIDKALEGSSSLDDAIVGVDSTRVQRENFGRDVVLDLSTQEREFENFYFPCNQILNSDRWEEGLMAKDQNQFTKYMQFRQQILNRFREYQIPIIILTKENSKEAVCLVFEKVNTGGVSLSVFELVTATYAADGFNLRDDWYGSDDRDVAGRLQQFGAKPLLRSLEPTDFLQAISLLHSYEQRQLDLRAGRAGKEVTAVSAKRDQVLQLPLNAYQKWADRLTEGFFTVERFLRRERFWDPDFLPYRSQIVPLAVVMVHLGERWQEPLIRQKLRRWFWCGVLGELYGGATETRIALDVQDLMAWIDQADASLPATVVAAGFQDSRLDTLRTRTSAAYRGLYVLLQREGAKDFFLQASIEEIDQDEYGIDIHHIFPRDWCGRNGISDKDCNSIVNKTPVSARANKLMGGRAPSVYLEQLRNHKQVQSTPAAQDELLKSHLIDPEALRGDDFAGFYRGRKRKLIELIEAVMGKSVVVSSEAPADDEG